VIGNLLLYYVTRKVFPEVRLWPRVRAALVGGVSVAVFGRYLLSSWAYGPVRFTLGVLVLALVFCLVVAALDRALLRDALQIVPKRRAKTA